MKLQIEEIVSDSMTRDIPRPKPREVHILRHPGKVSVLTGMRRSGKTWLCYARMQTLMSSGIARERLLYLNFEDDRFAGLTQKDLQWIPEAFFALYPDNREQTCHFFFDEIQLVPGWEAFIRRLIDEGKIEITLTGSSAKLLSREIASNLRGRALPTEVFPLSFREFCSFTGIRFDDKKQVIGAALRAKLRSAANRYRIAGGFPEVQDMTLEVREATLQEYFSAVILRDIIERHGVGNVVALRALVRHIAGNPATLFGINKFWGSLKSLGIALTKTTLMDYLKHLEDAYLCSFAELNDPSVRRRQANPKKAYVVDTGLVNASALPSNSDKGLQLENMVYMELRRRGCLPTYGKTVDGYEIDMIAGNDPSAPFIQACWTMSEPQTAEREIRALKIALRGHTKRPATIVTWDDPEAEQDGIHIVPFWKWALLKHSGS
jgi:predicted AAA+ superfamily ATPase